jgi:hypothetical protein
VADSDPRPESKQRTRFRNPQLVSCCL